MKQKKLLMITFCGVLVFALGAYLLVHFVFGFRYLSTGAPTQDIGKIKYVDSSGNDVFASAGAVVFQPPVRVSKIEVEGDIANITTYEFTVVRCPAYGVVTEAGEGRVVIDHGNQTVSTITGLSVVAVKVGDLLTAGSPLGATENQFQFSVSVSNLPLDMQWLLGSQLEKEEDEAAS